MIYTLDKVYSVYEVYVSEYFDIKILNEINDIAIVDRNKSQLKYNPNGKIKGNIVLKFFGNEDIQENQKEIIKILNNAIKEK